MPGPTTLRRFAQLGGRVVSLGSDAHRAEDIGASFEQACAMIPQAGLSGTAVFKGRSRSVMGLE